MACALSVTPAIALQDAPWLIRLTGLEPSSRIELTARMTTRDGTLWRSRAAFVADAAGTVDAAVQAPVEGSYHVIDPMGLVWSMERDGTQPAERHKLPLHEPVTVTFEARPSYGAAVQTTALRELAADGVTFKPLDNGDHRLRGGWWLPAGTGPHPAMIVLGGSGGGADHWRAALYASHGFAALALAYFGAPGLPRGLVNIPLEYVGEAIDYAIELIRPPRDFCAVEGISRGGELALLIGATFPRARAVIGVMASGLVMGSVGEPGEPGGLAGARLSRGDARFRVGRARHNPGRAHQRPGAFGKWPGRPPRAAVCPGRNRPPTIGGSSSCLAVHAFELRGHRPHHRAAIHSCDGWKLCPSGYRGSPRPWRHDRGAGSCQHRLVASGAGVSASGCGGLMTR